MTKYCSSAPAGWGGVLRSCQWTAPAVSHDLIRPADGEGDSQQRDGTAPAVPPSSKGMGKKLVCGGCGG